MYGVKEFCYKTKNMYLYPGSLSFCFESSQHLQEDLLQFEDIPFPLFYVSVN